MTDFYRFNMALSNGLKMFSLVKKTFLDIGCEKDPEKMHIFLLTQTGKKTLWNSCAHKKPVVQE